jgi:hypothetical protein
LAGNDPTIQALTALRRGRLTYASLDHCAFRAEALSWGRNFYLGYPKPA